jgi:hypothetical protein
MNIQKVTIVNKSDNKNILIKLQSPEDANEDFEKEFIPIQAMQNIELAYQNATANLFVKLDEENLNEIVWKGIVPTKVQHPIEIYPEERRVIFDGMILPDNFKTITSFNEGSKKSYNNIWLYFLIIAVIVIIIVGYLLKTGKIVL